VERIDLKENEQKVLYGLIAYPHLNDSQLSKKISIKLSTFTSVKRRLQQQNLFMQKKVPLLNRLGSEMLAVIHSEFNPIIPLKKRIEKAKESIEIYDEIFYSIGVQEKGFSISISKNYTNISKINDIRRELFGKLGLLEKEYPTEIIFPYQTSDIIRFFQFNRLIDSFYQLKYHHETTDENWFRNHETFQLNPKEKQVYAAIIKYPQATTQSIGEFVGLSRHTISRLKKKFYSQGIIKDITIPNLSVLGVESRAVYHFQFNPGKYPRNDDIAQIDTPSTIFLARKKYEMVLISAYPSYQDYKEDKMNKIRFLKENDFISYTPFVRKYMFDQMESIKEFDFAPITRKILEIPYEKIS
jgi:hypothetical protein